MLIQCNPITHSLYLSSCSHVAAFIFILAQKLPHLMGQSSTTCILVADFIIYLELHLLRALISMYNEMGPLWQRLEKWHEMSPRGWAQKGIVRFRICVGATKSRFIPKPSGKYRCHGILTILLTIL
jgi:hypothetical protein